MLQEFGDDRHLPSVLANGSQFRGLGVPYSVRDDFRQASLLRPHVELTSEIGSRIWFCLAERRREDEIIGLRVVERCFVPH